MTKLKSLIQLTAQYSYANETWKATTSLDINQRISYRGTDWAKKGDHAKWHYEHMDNILTKEERKHNYECRCLEQDIRPFHYTDEQWEEHLREVELEEHSALCEAANHWRYEI